MTTANQESTDSILRVLSTGKWFVELPDAMQMALVEGSTVQSFVSGQHIVEQGCHPDGIYAVLDGQVAFVRQLPGAREFLLNLAGSGYWFADPAILLGETMPHRVVARSAVRTLLVPATTVARIRGENALNATHFARMHAQRFVVAINGVADAAVLPKEAYLHRRLADLARLLGMSDESPDTDSIDIAVSQAELALMIGVSRQTLNGFLTEMHSKDLLKVGYRTISVRRALLSQVP